jgi:hypothetical protein
LFCSSFLAKVALPKVPQTRAEQKKFFLVMLGALTLTPWLRIASADKQSPDPYQDRTPPPTALPFSPVFSDFYWDSRPDEARLYSIGVPKTIQLTLSTY